MEPGGGAFEATGARSLPRWYTQGKRVSYALDRTCCVVFVVVGWLDIAAGSYVSAIWSFLLAFAFVRIVEREDVIVAQERLIALYEGRS